MTRVVQGAAAQALLPVARDGRAAALTLLARRARTRAFPRRAAGLDAAGESADLVETEQILEAGR